MSNDSSKPHTALAIGTAISLFSVPFAAAQAETTLARPSPPKPPCSSFEARDPNLEFRNDLSNGVIMDRNVPRSFLNPIAVIDIYIPPIIHLKREPNTASAIVYPIRAQSPLDVETSVCLTREQLPAGSRITVDITTSSIQAKVPGSPVTPPPNYAKLQNDAGLQKTLKEMNVAFINTEKPRRTH
ncbi:MAG TPA: hypothetical protein VGZ00_04400 [Candidatus Baltobacteraceae bacterium]|jgi:hypothetical protein|nr:hypothetical protein [Candidatus Baltobacteraceae bacterium]